MKHRFLALVGWLLLACPLLRAQTRYICQYWFDGNYAAHTDITIDTDHWQTPIEASHLTLGLHTLYLHLQDTSGQWTSPRSYLFYRMADTLSHQPTATYQCWFDQDRSTLQQGLIGDGNLLIETATLASGMHTFNLQLGNGMAARLQSFLFYKVPVADSGNLNMTYSCWFDQDTSTMQSGNVGNGHLLIDATAISDGLHTFNLQLNSGNLTNLQSYLFYRMPIQDSGDLALVYRCWFDQDYNTLQHGNIGDGHLLLETSTLSDGLHTLNIQLGNGNAARLSSHLFMKMSSQLSMADSTPLWWHYSIDGTAYPPISVPRSGQLIHLELDVSTISDGLHTLSHFLMTESGSTLGLFSSLFYKIPLGGNGVTRYDYWYNDDETTLQRVTLAAAVDTLRLIQLLDVDTMPFRSTSFQFDPHGGSPMVYARNKINFRFWDGMSRFVSSSKDFIDERVNRTVLADTLERDTTKVIPVPNNNAIHWFKLYADVGDSLSFHTDRCCTMQLFAPSGEEVFSTSGQQVLTWQGCHAWEDGVYYLAVHDAEGNGSIAVSYQWFYKYAVLEYSPKVIGNAPSMVTVHLWGNGYDKLVNVSFFNSDTVWVMDSILISNINEAFLDFVSSPELSLGYYNMLLEFIDTVNNRIDSLIVNNALNVVLANYGNIDISYDYISSFTEPHIITLSISNNGNVPYMGVPIVFAHTRSDVALLRFSEQNLLLDSIEVIDGFYHNAINLFDRAVNATYLPLMLNRIEPYQTLSMQIEFSCPRGQSFDFYSWAGKPWSLFEPDTVIERQNAKMPTNVPSSKMTNTGRDMCDMPDPCDIAGAAECLCGTALGGIKSLAGSLAAPILNGMRRSQEWAREQGYEDDIYHDELPHLQTPESILRDAMSHCVPERAEAAAGALFAAWDMLDGDDCPNPTPIHPRVPAPPVDPNEITGYTATSGSKAIGNRQSILPYIIEYENDSLLASGMAHVVVVNDTLDGRYFNLESFSATSFSIENEVTSINGGQNFIRTVDMRPEINVLAQVQLDYRIDTTFAVATWTFTSLDPMTLQPTVADSLGFLGIGKTGEVDFTINRKADLPDSALIDNRAWIVFDNEEPIATSTWRNIIDNTPPISQIDSIVYHGDTATVTITATDNLSGVWRYNFYALMDGDVLLPMAMNVPIDSAAMFTTPNEIVQFRSTAIDSAGNVGPLTLTPFVTTFYDTLTVTACDNYTWGDSTYTVSGEYTQNKSAMLRNAPDTVATLFLTVHHSTTGTETVTACDSYTWHDSVYTSSTLNSQFSTLNSVGCDSVTTLYLTVNYSTSSSETVTTCDSYTWHDSVYTASTLNSQFSTLNSLGCDSTVTLHLTINNSTTGIETATACDSYTWHDSVYTASTLNSQFSTLNSLGCDSTVTLHLTINNSTTAIETATACDSYTWHGTAYTASTTTPTYSTYNAVGCDSTVTLHLTINNSTTAIETATACDSYTWHGTAYTASTNTPTYTNTNAFGCDSVTTLYLTVNYSTSSTETVTACDSYTWHDSTYTASTLNAQFSTLNSLGCDSTVTLHLTINYNDTTHSTESICNGDSLRFNGSWLTTEGTYNYTLQNAQGCDSLLILTLTVKPTSESIVTDTACDSYTWHDSTYTASTLNAQFSTLNSVGCDSTVTLHLTINYSTRDTIVDSALGSYTWNGNTYTESGEYIYQSYTQEGCDSVVVLQLTITEVGINIADSNSNVTLYPNPTTGKVTILADGIAKVEVFDPSGRSVSTFYDTNEIDIHNLPSGSYTLRITFRNGIAVKRVIKQ